MTQGIRLPLLAGLAILLAWPLVFGTSYDLRVFTLAGVYALLTLGFQFIFGHAGALALTQGTFFGVGAYITALLALNFGWGFEATLPLAIAGRSCSRSSSPRRCCGSSRTTSPSRPSGSGR